MQLFRILRKAVRYRRVWAGVSDERNEPMSTVDVGEVEPAGDAVPRIAVERHRRGNRWMHWLKK